MSVLSDLVLLLNVYPAWKCLVPDEVLLSVAVRHHHGQPVRQAQLRHVADKTLHKVALAKICESDNWEAGEEAGPVGCISTRALSLLHILCCDMQIPTTYDLDVVWL